MGIQINKRRLTDLINDNFAKVGIEMILSTNLYFFVSVKIYFLFFLYTFTKWQYMDKDFTIKRCVFSKIKL